MEPVVQSIEELLPEEYRNRKEGVSIPAEIYEKAEAERRRQQVIYINYRIQELLEKGDEQGAADFIDMMGNSGGAASLLKQYYRQFKDKKILYHCIVDVYSIDGYNFPRCLMLEAKRIAPTIDPQERYGDLPAGDTVTVYRGVTRDMWSRFPRTFTSPKFGISWTTNKNVAIWFAYRHDTELPGVYQGTIKRDKIIAYDNGRKEFEVMQHGNVQNIVKLNVTQEEIDAAMQWHDENTKSWSDIDWDAYAE